jgi:hypothetical protein
MKLIEAADKLVKLAPPLLAQHFRPDCCIAATRVAMEVLLRLGFPTKAQPTEFAVYTRNLWQRRHQFDGNFRDDEWSVAVGRDLPDIKFHSNPNGYNGHLVCIAGHPGMEHLVDLTVGQASRPARGLTLPPAWHWPFEGWPLHRGNERIIALYKPKVNPAFVRAPDWTDWKRTDHIIETILKEIHETKNNPSAEARRVPSVVQTSDGTVKP